jgi:microcystin-dependent protein
MGTPFLGEVRIFAFGFAPRGWALCNGQFLPINQNQALFALLGTMYGGNGQTTFALPNLQGRIPVHVGPGFVQGQQAGETTHTLILSEMAQHTHPVMASSLAQADQPAPAGNLWANGGQPAYAPAANANMRADLVSSAGGNQPHNNMPPYLALNICMALQGIFPSMN